MTRTFLDSGILLTGWKGQEIDRDKARALMEDPEREFVAYQTLRLELFPKSSFFKSRSETAFYSGYFNRIKGEERLSEGLVDEAMKLGMEHGLAAADALNLAAAFRQGPSEFIITELPGGPLFRAKRIRVISLHAAAVG